MSKGVLQVLIFEHQIKVVTPQGNIRIFMTSELNTILDMLHLTKTKYEVIDYVQTQL